MMNESDEGTERRVVSPVPSPLRVLRSSLTPSVVRSSRPRSGECKESEGRMKSGECHGLFLLAAIGRYSLHSSAPLCSGFVPHLLRIA